MDIQNIQQIATRFEKLEKNTEQLFQEINQLPSEAYQESLDGYEKYFQIFAPVSMLRYELFRQLSKGGKVSQDLIDEVKHKIISRDIDYFESYPDSILESFIDAEIKDGAFKVWKNPFKLFYILFYNHSLKNQVRSFLQNLAEEILAKLQLSGFKHHFVHFDGPTNFGYTKCWLALFPEKRVNHQRAYQLFLMIKGNHFQAGIVSGGKIEKYRKEETFQDLASAIDYLESLKQECLELNDKLFAVWKYAAGEQGVHWDEMYNDGIMAIGWNEVDDLSNHTRESLADILKVNNPENSNAIWNLENFLEASLGDVIVSNRGTKTCLGIGVISGPYRYEESRGEFPHVRPVKWLIHQEIKFEKSIFRRDTFSPTKRWDQIKEAYLKTYPELEDTFNQIEAGKDIKNLNSSSPVGSEARQYWWLNANPKIWSIDSFKVGDVQQYTSHNEKGNKRRIYKYFQEVKPGDIVFGYESTPVKQIKAIFEIVEGLHEGDEGESISFRINEILEEPVDWSVLKQESELENCEVMINNQGSLFKIREDEYEVIQAIIDEQNISLEQSFESYSIKQALSEIFLQESEFRQLLDLLDYKQNIVLQGPPGVGKTFIAKRIAYALMGLKDDNCVRMVQFHQSYSYEDFVQGIRPSENGFEIKNGIFYEFCQKAKRNPDRKYYFVIDEINRGNLSKIFGELMMLIEADKRGIDYQIPLTYAANDMDFFYVPENVYLIGTMNTADRSLALVDYALRRRFAFVNLYPKLNDKLRTFLSQKLPEPFIEQMMAKINQLNSKISQDKNLGPGFQIGHSYFCNLKQTSNPEQWFKNIVQYEIQPLLEEYWFDDLELAQQQVDNLLS